LYFSRLMTVQFYAYGLIKQIHENDNICIIAIFISGFVQRGKLPLSKMDMRFLLVSTDYALYYIVLIPKTPLPARTKSQKMGIEKNSSCRRTKQLRREVSI